MYAIVDIADKQFKIREDETLYVPYQDQWSPDDSINIDRVLLFSNGDGDVHIGEPLVDDAVVEATVLDHVKGDKVLVFKKKRRKRYRIKRGHRQRYTQLRIDSLSLNSDS